MKTLRPDEFLSARSVDHNALWRRALAQAAHQRSKSLATILSDFFGYMPENCLDEIVGIHHVAVYLGDYHADTQVDQWHAFLQEKLCEGTIRSLGRGPSYIAARHYDTQGWWFTADLADGSSLEMFCCRHYGSWGERPLDSRHRLMSHVALQVARADHVQELLSRFAGHGTMRVLAYTENDVVGHTYGHLRNETSLCVLEIVA